jgi:hypothetical protein
MRSERVFYVIILLSIFLMASVAPVACAEDSGGGPPEDPPKDQKRSNNPVLNINRFQCRFAITDGESACVQSAFVQFPNKFFIAEYLEVLTPVAGGSELSHRNFNFEMTAGKPLSTGNDAWRVLGLVGRIQVGSGQKTDVSAGMQWNITGTGGLAGVAKKLKLEAFVQIFPLKMQWDENGVDAYSWVQLKGFSDLFYVRGTAGYYVPPHTTDFVFTFWDVIFPLNRSFDLYARYAYQNKENFNKSEGSQVSLGARFNFTF